MNKEIMLVVDAVSNEKGVDKAVIFDALEAALASITRKTHPDDIDARVAINQTTGDYDTFRRWHVVAEEELESPDHEKTLEEAKALNPELEIGDTIEEPVESLPISQFGRIAAQTAKQVIVQKVREAERLRVVEQYRGHVGQLIGGNIKRQERHGVVVDLGGNAEAYIPREDIIVREPIRVGDRVRGYLREVRHEPRGPQLFISRTAPEFLIELFKLEVPEIGQDLIRIHGAARDPGQRAKVAVESLDPRLDPIGACIGMRGSRVQAVTNELAGERVDIILWDENAAQFVINAMAPAEVESIVVDEDSHSMDIAVAEDNLAQAIGRGGQNIKLATELTGWTLNVMTSEQADEKSEVEAKKVQDVFVDQLGVDEEVAGILVQEGFSSLEGIAYVPTQELVEIEEFDEDIVEELRNRARDVLLTKAIATAEGDDDQPGELRNLDGMTEELAQKMMEKGIGDQEELAEQAVDDLLELIPELDEQQAADLIMAARAPWFAAEENAS